jgi:alpha-L-fucosidase
MIRKTIFAMMFVLCSGLTMAQPYQSNWESINSRPIPEWFSDVKFGIFIHWGIYSVPAWAPANEDIGVYAKYAEWYWWRIMNPGDKAGQLFRDYHNKMYGEDFLYQDFAPMFKAEHFDPAQWADLFKRAGAKYVVLTSKHHEGFTLWPSAQSWNWNSVDIGAHRDLCGDLSVAVKDAGLKMGFYYSLYEWFNPLYRNNLDKYVDDHMIPQMKDLVTRYEPSVLWTDGEWDHPSESWKSTEFLSWLYNESSVKDHVVVNDRWGKESRGKQGGFYTTEYDLVHDGMGIGTTNHPWEECRGIGTSFGYNRIETPDNYMTAEGLVHLLIEKVAAGGNLLLNVGPTADGRIPAIQQQRLLEMGKWLEVNGDAIYDTRKWDGTDQNKNLENVYFTRKGNDLYVICTKFPEKPVSISGVKRNGRVTMPGFDGSVRTRFSSGNLIITPPAITPANNPSEHAWVFKVENVL